ncbi:AraC family transcriptional regulator [Escherichia sp. TWPC-MK]
MSSRVLTPDVVGIDALVHDHQTVLAKAEGGVVAVFANNAPAFYAVTPARLAELLALEEKLARPGSNVGFDDQLYFSRVFKKCTGASPSEFRAGCEEKVNDVAVKLTGTLCKHCWNTLLPNLPCIH